jgi:hypothetical protein
LLLPFFQGRFPLPSLLVDIAYVALTLFFYKTSLFVEAVLSFLAYLLV